MELDGIERGEFCEALCYAYPRKRLLAQMLNFELGIKLNMICAKGNLSDTVFKLVEWAEAHDTVKELLNGAYNRNPTNRELNSFINKMKLKHQSSQNRESNYFLIPLAPNPVAASQPIPILDDLQESSCLDGLTVPASLLRQWGGSPRDFWAVNVVGYSMIERQISPKSTLIIKRQRVAESGNIVVAYLLNEGGATLKTYFLQEDGQLRLQPANKDFEPIYTTADNLVILGLVVHVFPAVG